MAQRARRRLGLSLAEFARHLGYTGLQPTLSRLIRRYERGERPIGRHLAEKVRALAKA